MATLLVACAIYTYLVGHAWTSCAPFQDLSGIWSGWNVGTPSSLRRVDISPVAGPETLLLMFLSTAICVPLVFAGSGSKYVRSLSLRTFGSGS